MASRTHAHTKARQTAVKVLYSAEICSLSPSQIVEQGAYPEEGGIIDDYALTLIEGVEQHRDELDELLGDASKNWAIARMPIIDRCVLRLAAYEMLHVDSVPLSVSINEAVELAKAFGGEDESHRFVNGVLGRIAAHLSGDMPDDDAEIELPEHTAVPLDGDEVAEVDSTPEADAQADDAGQPEGSEEAMEEADSHE